MQWDQEKLHPKAQNWTQRCAEKAEKQHCAPQSPDENKQPQFTVLSHDHEKQCCGCSDACECIKCGFPYPAAQRAQSAGKIIGQCQCAAQQYGAEKLGKLLRDLVAHGGYPNRRRRKPLWGAVVRSS